MPERLECEVLQKARYINTLTHYMQLPNIPHRIRRFTTMRYINRLFTYLLTYLLTVRNSQKYYTHKISKSVLREPIY